MRPTPALAIALLAASALCGCAAGPDYAPPTIGAPDHYRGQALVHLRQSPPAPIQASAWWKAFNDPVLDRFVGLALSQNLDLAQSAARVTQARAGLGAASAALAPSARIDAQATKVRPSTQTPTGRLLSANPDFDRDGALYEANLGASWELDVFGGTRRQQQAARSEYQAAQADAAAARLSIAALTADTYMLIRGLQERLEVARDLARTQRRLAETIALQRQNGVAADLQLQQARAALAQTEASVPGLEDGLQAALNAMDVLLGAQPGAYQDELARPSAIPLAPSIADAGGPADLIRRRPDLVVAERRLSASSARVGSALSEYFPKFSLSGLVGTATTTRSSAFQDEASQIQGVLGLRWRLFDFYRVQAEVRLARGREAEALAAYEQAVLRATQDVEDAFAGLVKRERQAQILADGEQALTKARASSEAAYGAGVVSLVEVLDADAQLLAVRDARAQARAETARAAVRSFQALGGGWSVGEPG